MATKKTAPKKEPAKKSATKKSSTGDKTFSVVTDKNGNIKKILEKK